jgi:MFS family permease
VSIASKSASAEWAAYWYLPLTAALGISGAGLHVYSIGPFMPLIQQSFDWSRTQTLSGTAIVSVAVALFSLPIGALIDKCGPRRIALTGVLSMGVSVALLGTATGTKLNWLLLWLIVAVSAVPVQAMVWTSAVVSRFVISRGLALGITLSGTSFAVFALPLLSTWLVKTLGWHHAFFGLGGVWVLTAFPLVYLFFRGAQDEESSAPQTFRASADVLPGLSLREALKTRVLQRLLLSTALFVLVIYGGVIHFIPILRGNGASPLVAAAAASMIGIFSMIGRLGTAAVIDRFPAHRIGAASFILPVPACLILLTRGFGTGGDFAAAALYGLTLGSEVDVITYLFAQRFGLKSVGALLGALVCTTAVGAALGPLAAAAVFDHFGNYNDFLIASILVLVPCAFLIGSIGPGSTQIVSPEPVDGARDVSRSLQNSRQGNDRQKGGRNE